jgi:hypothetical protein
VELVEIVQDALSKVEEFAIRFDEISYQTMGDGDNVTPYGIFVLTLIQSINHLQENVQGILGKPALWMERPLNSPNDTFAPVSYRSMSPMVERLRGWEGEGSGIKQDRYALITNKTDWEKLWKEHNPNEAAPEVDFEKEQVAAFFQEVPAGWGGVKVTGLLSNNARTVLHVRGTSYQTEGAPPELTMSYGFHVFAKELKLVLELPSYVSMDAPPRWLETAWK